jgi:hypothetical protein
MKSKILAVSLLLILCVAAAAQQPAEVTRYELRYTPNDELATLQQVHAKIEEVALENNPLGIEGWMKAKLEHRAGAVNEETKTFALTLELEEIAQEFNGQPIGGAQQSRISVDLTPLGQIKNPRQVSDTDTPAAALAAGVPVQMLALLCHVVTFPDHPVAIGERWVNEEAVDVGQDAPVTLRIATELLQVTQADEQAEEQGQQATLLSDMDLLLSDFKAPNPMGYGDPVTVQNGRLTITDLTREFDMQNGVVVEAEGKAGFSGQMVMAGFPLNLRVTLNFSMKPQPAQKNAPATAGGAGDDEAQAGAGQGGAGGAN